MALAPLRSGPHTVRADRLAFAAPVPVREAAGGHWITLGHHGDDEEGGGVHVYIAGGSGPGSGTITKGPKGLLGHHIAALASHPSVSKAQHHPVGHEPPGARDHPHYAETSPNAERPSANAGQEATKRPGKPYARLSGAEQGTRQEQIGKALSEAQGAAKGAKAKPISQATERAGKKGTFGERREATVKAMQEKESRRGTPYRVLGVSDDVTTCEICGKTDLKRTVALHNEVSGVVRAGSDCAAMLLRTSRASIEKAARQHGEKREAAIQKALESHPNQEIIKRFAGQIQRVTAYHRGQKSTPSESDQSRMAFARQRIAALTAEARRDIEKQFPADKPLPESGQTALAKPFSAPQQPPEQDKVADTAVAHQQAQAELAAHRAKNDRNPNPWAPHLSPPVGDAKDRELAEKATRAQLAHQAAQAQQQGEAQQRQTEGQRAHEKEMVRLKAETSAPKPEVAPLKAKGGPASAHDEAHVAYVMHAHKGKDAAAQGKYRDFMQRIVHGDTYRPTMQDGRPLTKASASEALRRMNGETPRQAAAPTRKAQQPATIRPSSATERPWDYVSPAAQKRMDASKAEQARKTAEEDRRNLEGALIHNAQYAPEAFTRDRAQAQAAMQDRLMAEHREKHGDEANRQLKELMDTARYAGRRYGGMRNASELVRPEVDAARQRQQQTRPAPSAPATPPAIPAHTAHEDTLQHLRDHVVARNPVGHSVSPAHVMREMPGATRQEAIAHLDALAQRGVLRQNAHHANFYEVLPGHGTSGPGKGDAPAADIRRAPAPKSGKSKVRESATPAPCFSAPAAR